MAKVSRFATLNEYPNDSVEGMDLQHLLHPSTNLALHQKQRVRGTVSGCELQRRWLVQEGSNGWVRLQHHERHRSGGLHQTR